MYEDPYDEYVTCVEFLCIVFVLLVHGVQGHTHIEAILISIAPVVDSKCTC